MVGPGPDELEHAAIRYPCGLLMEFMWWVARVLQGVAG